MQVFTTKTGTSTWSEVYGPVASRIELRALGDNSPLALSKRNELSKFEEVRRWQPKALISLSADDEMISQLDFMQKNLDNHPNHHLGSLQAIYAYAEFTNGNLSPRLITKFGYTEETASNPTPTERGFVGVRTTARGALDRRKVFLEVEKVVNELLDEHPDKDFVCMSVQYDQLKLAKLNTPEYEQDHNHRIILFLHWVKRAEPLAPYIEREFSMDAWIGMGVLGKVDDAVAASEWETNRLRDRSHTKICLFGVDHKWGYTEGDDSANPKTQYLFTELTETDNRGVFRAPQYKVDIDVKFGPGKHPEKHSDVQWLAEKHTPLFERNSGWGLQYLGHKFEHGDMKGAGDWVYRSIVPTLFVKEEEVQYPKQLPVATLWLGRGGNLLTGDEEDAEMTGHLVSLGEHAKEEADIRIMRTSYNWGSFLPGEAVGPQAVFFGACAKKG